MWIKKHCLGENRKLWELRVDASVYLYQYLPLRNLQWGVLSQNFLLSPQVPVPVQDLVHKPVGQFQLLASSSSIWLPVPVNASNACYLDLKALLQRRPDWV